MKKYIIKSPEGKYSVVEAQSKEKLAEILLEGYIIETEQDVKESKNSNRGKMRKLLKFKEHKQRGSTKKFDVFSNHSGVYIGTIHWRFGWRCYVISYANDVDMSRSCNKELNKFMEKLEKERRNVIPRKGVK